MTAYRTLPAAVLMISQLASGCSGTAEPDQTALAEGSAPVAAAAPYQLNDEEKALDCKKLTGRMQVRILQVRDYNARSHPSALSQAVKNTASAVSGSDAPAVESQAGYARDRAQLEAYNQRLASLNCKTFNLDSELQPKPVTATPTPIAKSKDGVTITLPVDKVGGAAKAKTP